MGLFRGWEENSRQLGNQLALAANDTAPLIVAVSSSISHAQICVPPAPLRASCSLSSYFSSFPHSFASSDFYSLHYALRRKFQI
jgi:hypothetical protein